MKKYLGVFFLLSSLAYAGQELVIPMHKIDEKGIQEQIGTIKVTENKHGLVFTPDLENLPPGVHGFHIHENPDCGVSMHEGKAVAGGGAGGHYDPSSTKKHEGPWGEGHLGDLPVLYVNSDGKANVPVLAPRLKKLDEIKGRSVMIHEGGDNYSDIPAPLGGGGKRIACGVIEKTIDKK